MHTSYNTRSPASALDKIKCYCCKKKGGAADPQQPLNMNFSRLINFIWEFALKETVQYPQIAVPAASAIIIICPWFVDFTEPSKIESHLRVCVHIKAAMHSLLSVCLCTWWVSEVTKCTCSMHRGWLGQCGGQQGPPGAQRFIFSCPSPSVSFLQISSL